MLIIKLVTMTLTPDIDDKNARNFPILLTNQNCHRHHRYNHYHTRVLSKIRYK